MGAWVANVRAMLWALPLYLPLPEWFVSGSINLMALNRGLKTLQAQNHLS